MPSFQNKLMNELREIELQNLHFIGKREKRMKTKLVKYK